MSHLVGVASRGGGAVRRPAEERRDLALAAFIRTTAEIAAPRPAG